MEVFHYWPKFSGKKKDTSRIKTLQQLWNKWLAAQKRFAGLAKINESECRNSGGRSSGGQNEALEAADKKLLQKYKRFRRDITKYRTFLVDKIIEEKQRIEGEGVMHYLTNAIRIYNPYSDTHPSFDSPPIKWEKMHSL